MNDKTRKLLTEKVIWEEWHGLTGNLSPDGKWGMCACGRYCVVPENHQTRTFAIEADMMALYRAIQKEGKWNSFLNYAKTAWYKREDLLFDDDDCDGDAISSITNWLFCLNGEGYEQHCQMVADWMKGEKR